MNYSFRGFQQRVLGLFFIAVISMGMMGTGLAATYVANQKVVGGDLSKADWNAVDDVLNSLQYTGSQDGWGFSAIPVSGIGVTANQVRITSGPLTVHEITTPLSAVTDSVQLYPKLDNKLYYLDADNVEHEIATGGSISGTTNTVAKFSATGIEDSNITDDGSVITMGSNVSFSTFGLLDNDVTVAIPLGDGSNTSLVTGASLVGAINTSYQNTQTNATAINSLQNELDATQTGAGLNANGTKAAWTSTNYLTANNLKGGIEELDAAIAGISNGLQLTDSNTTAGATCTSGEVGTIEYTDNGTMGEFIGCAHTGTGPDVYTWVRLSIYTQ